MVLYKMSEFSNSEVLNSISYASVMDMLRVTMLVYNYGKDISLTDDNMTVETFVDKMKQSGGFDKLNLNETRKGVLEDIANNIPNGKLAAFINDEETDLQVGVTVSELNKRISVVFRGSESKSDWYYDLMIFKHKLTDKISVHSGFHKQLTDNKTYEKLMEKLKELLMEHPDYAVYVTGHSLGGALSTLFGYMLSNEIDNQVTVISFASPRVGNYEWKQAFEQKTNLTHYRITNNRDIVTAFPLYRYYHVGHNIRLFDDKFDLFDRDTLRGWYDETFLTCWSVAEHDCELYYNRLTNANW